MTTAERNLVNETRLKKISPSIRAKVAAVLTDLEGHGFQPLIDAQVWRSPAEQAALKKKGYSKVSYSFHNCTTKDGRPDSLAADITDARYGWDSPKKFWLMLAASAEAHGLNSGIYWGLPQSKRNEIRKAIKERNFNQNLSLGWDVAHVEPKGISILAARLGKRPKA